MPLASASPNGGRACERVGARDGRTDTLYASPMMCCAVAALLLMRHSAAQPSPTSAASQFSPASEPPTSAALPVVVDLGLLQPLPTDGAAKLAEQVAVQTCAGLLNRERGVVGRGVYTLISSTDVDWLFDTDGVCVHGVKYPAGAACGMPSSPPTVTPTERSAFLRACISAKRSDGSMLVSGAIRFNASRTAQQLLVPNIVTLAAVLDALPLQSDHPLAAAVPVVFNAIDTFRGMGALEATEYMHTHYINRTTSMAQMNPGLDVHGDNKINPPLTQDLNPGLIDYIVKERLFNFFMLNQCIKGTPEHRLMEKIVTENPWPRPIAVMGYDDTWALAGDIFEAETNCVKEHNMGQIASDGVNNLAFYSRDPPITQPLVQPRLDSPTFNASKTYLAIVIGDGDNTGYMKDSRRSWFMDRVSRCTKNDSYGSCFPLLWTASPQLLHLAPDWLQWYYAGARRTGHDYFVLPPSGDLYSYPGEMQSADQQQFVQNTERDCHIMNTSATVEWEWFDTWPNALSDYYPRYSDRGIVRGLFAVNVPYMLPIWLFKPNEYYRIIDPRGVRVSSPLVLFRPR